LGTVRSPEQLALTLHGTVKYGPDTLPFGGLNQFAIPVGGIGAFTSDWGSTLRALAIGQHVTVHYRLVPGVDVPFSFAVGGFPILSGGVTIAGLAALLQQFGAANGVNLDGGGSTTLVARDPGASTVTVRNTPTDSTGERLVANGIGIFIRKI
jgi:phosphodiester glycosidase